MPDRDRRPARRRRPGASAAAARLTARTSARALVLGLGLAPAVAACGLPGASTTAGPTPAATASARSFADAPDGAAELTRVRDTIVRTGVVDEGSLASLRALYATWPQEPEVVDALENALIRRDDWPGLALLYDELPALTPDRRGRYGQALLEQGRFDDALAVLRPLADEHPFQLEYLILTTRAEFRAGDPAAAARRLDPALPSIRQYRLTDGLVLRGQIALAEDNPQRARALFEEALAIDGSLAARDAYDGLGRALEALGETAASRDVFERLDTLERGNTEFAARRMRAHGQVKAIDEAWRAGEVEQAEKLLDLVLADGAETLSLTERRMLDGLAAAVYGARGRAEEAAAAATRAAEPAP